MAKEELFRVPLLSQLIRALGAFPVRRGGGDRQAIKTAMQLLKEKRAVCIFPEGTRSKTGELGHFHLGAALIALKTRSPIVPVAIVGPYRLFRPIRVIFGEPIDPSSFLGGENDKEAAGRLTETLQNRIRQMMESHR
jgi:1-acyl-sn-glycerol-3-phosphate acyltransferase